MSANRKDISQISQYLKSQLDNADRHELERAAQDDLFLMEALEGYEFSAKAPDEDINALHKRLEARVTERRSTRLLWRTISIAACLLLILGSGYWLVTRQQLSQQTARVAKPVISPKIKPADSLIAAQPAPAVRKKHQPKHLAKSDLIAAVPSRIKIEPLSQAVIIPQTHPENRPVPTVEKLLQGKIAPANTNQTNTGTFYGATSKSNLPGFKDTGKLNMTPDKNYAYRGDTVIRGYVKLKTDLPHFVLTGKEVQDNPVATVPELLQGKVANLNIQNNTGAPGLRGSVNIRGLTPAPSTEIRTVPVPVGYHLISGQIIDSASGVPMQSVTIGMFGRGVIQTDRYGKFAVAVPAKGEFYVTAAGYKAQMIEIDKKTSFSITLNQAPVLNEPVIRGLISRDKSTAKYDQPAAKKVVITPKTAGDTVCHENIKFRDRFLGSIGIAIKRDFEKNNGIPITVSDKQYNKALKFLAKYVDLDQTPYQWHNWYDANKCNFIK